MDTLEQTVLAPAMIVVGNSGVAGQVMGQMTPLTARAYQIQDGIHDVAIGDFARSSHHPWRTYREEARDQFPLGIGEIRWIRLSGVHEGLFHAHTLPYRISIHILRFRVHRIAPFGKTSALSKVYEAILTPSLQKT